MATQRCPCGFYGDSSHQCTCSRGNIERYQKRTSGPLLDRLDIHVQVPRGDYEKLTNTQLGESSSAVRERVEAARERQRHRFTGTRLHCNADKAPREIRQYCSLDAEVRALAKAALRQLGLSARRYHRVLKLARTIADLVNSEHIAPTHLAEALQCRLIQND